MTTSTETPTVIRPPDSKTSGFSRFVRFLGRLILLFLKLLPLLLIIVGLLVAAWLGYQEFHKSIGEVNERIDWNSDQTTQLRGIISTISTDLSTLQSQQSEIEEDTEQIAGHISVIGDDLMRQIGMLTTMEEQVAALEINADSIAENVSALDEGFKAQQSDSTSNVTQIDSLGRQIDDLGVSMITLRNGIATNSEAIAQEELIVAKLTKTLTLFRIWETVARARLHLANENIGLAQTDIVTAQSMLDKMAADGSDVLAEALQQTQSRLDLAANNLPDDPGASVRDLNTAWEALDAALTTMLEGVPSVEPATEGE